MALDLEEQEQLDELKAWWKQHGKWLITGVTALVLAVVAWNGWQTWTAKQQAEGSLLFDRAVQAGIAQDQKAIKEVTGQIMESYSGSGYATPAAWLAGRSNEQAGDLKSAVAQYRFALEHAKGEAVEQLARLRLAAVLLDSGDYQAALKQLEQPHAAAFAGLYANLKGDVLAAQGKTAEAHAAYTLALDKLGEKSALKPLVEIKLDGLGS